MRTSKCQSIKRPKLSSADGEEKISASPRVQCHANVLELSIPFLPLVEDAELFLNISLVSKTIQQHCQRLLRDHCKEHHPLLLLSTDRSSNESSSSERGRLLTYRRYRRFMLDTEATTCVVARQAANLDRLAEYEALLEISTLENEEHPKKVIAYDIQPLRYMHHRAVDGGPGIGCDFSPYSRFPAGEDTRDSANSGLCVRVMLRRVSTGEMAIVLHQTETESEEARSMTYTNPVGELVLESTYKTTSVALPFYDNGFHAKVIVWRRMATDGDDDHGGVEGTNRNRLLFTDQIWRWDKMAARVIDNAQWF